MAAVFLFHCLKRESSPHPSPKSEALRAQKQRVYEAMRNSHRYNHICYLQQLEAIEDEYGLHLERNPSKRQVRRMMAAVCRFVESAVADSYTVALDDNCRVTVTFG